MEFLNPAALYGLFLLPLLLIPYLIRRRPRRVTFSSVLLLRNLAAPGQSRPWGRLRLPPVFFLQLLVLALLIFALGDPVFLVRPVRIAILLDNSASMQALEGGKSRFEMAREEAARLIRSFGPRTRIAVFVSAPAIGKRGGDLSPAEALNLVAKLRPYDLGEPAHYGEALAQLAREGNYDRLFFVTDRPAQGQGSRVRVVSIGERKGNLAVTSFRITRASFGSSRLEARVEVTSFSSRHEKFKVTVKGEGKVLASRAGTLSPRTSTTLLFEAVLFFPYYEAELSPQDALPLDNRRFALAPVRELEILAVSPRPEAVLSLRSLPGVRVEAISPGEYEKRAGKRSLEIFHYAAPDVLPKAHALFVLPPRENPFVAVGAPLSDPKISSWREPHILTRYINFSLFRPRYARPLKPLSFGDAVIESPEGPLGLVSQHEGYRYLFLGFDPFPYLGRENIPVSIFTLNVLGWFYEGLMAPSLATGKPLEFAAHYRGGTVVTPAGEKFAVKEAGFAETFFQGIYQVSRGDKKEIFAVNLEDFKESDLLNPLPVKVARDSSSQNSSLLYPLWPYLLLCALVLLLLEWFLRPEVAL